MKKKNNADMHTLVGIVTPYAWDEDGQVLDVSISATDDEEYIIDNNTRFIDLVQQPIRAMGIVTYGKKAHRRINVKKFELLDNETFLDQGQTQLADTLSGNEYDRPAENAPKKKSKRSGHYLREAAWPLSSGFDD